MNFPSTLHLFTLTHPSPQCSRCIPYCTSWTTGSRPLAPPKAAPGIYQNTREAPVKDTRSPSAARKPVFVHTWTQEPTETERGHGQWRAYGMMKPARCRPSVGYAGRKIASQDIELFVRSPPNRTYEYSLLAFIAPTGCLPPYENFTRWLKRRKHATTFVCDDLIACKGVWEAISSFFLTFG